MTASTDTDGLVERLRAGPPSDPRAYWVPDTGKTEELLDQAADTIQAQAARIAVLEGALEGVCDSLEHELKGRDILHLFATEIEPDQELIDWLGPDEGRKVIAAVLRLRIARQALSGAV